MYSVNATSLAKPNALQLLHADLKSYNIHVALVVETWFNDKIDDALISIDNYVLVRLDRYSLQKRKGGGVCAYVRNDVVCSTLKQRNLSVPDLEYMWIRCAYANKSYVIACIYHPPKPRYPAQMLIHELTADLEELSLSNPDSVFILAGDFNSLDTSFLCDDFGLQQLVVTPTHGSKIIDKMFVSHQDIYHCSVVKSVLKTKHMAVLLHSSYDIGPQKLSGNRKKATVLDLREPFINKLRYYIGTFDWNGMLNGCININDVPATEPVVDIDAVYATFLETIHSLIGYCIPCKTITVGPRDPDFVTPQVKCLLRKRYRLRRHGRLEEANAIASKINELIVANRSKKLAKIANATTKELWANVRGKSTKNRQLLIGGKQVSAEELNQFFTTISTDPNYKLEHITAFQKPDAPHTDPITSAFHNNFVQNYQIEHLLRRLNNTAPGCDNLPAWLFKKCSVELADVVANLINLSFQTGKVYSNWRTALVTPVPKVATPTTMSEFRPISVTPILSRIAEKLMVKHWLYPAIPPATIQDQFAFRPSGSTSCALVNLMHHVSCMLENNSYVRCLTIDFSKAFDVVSHDVLLHKVSLLALPHNIHNWIVSFLIGRRQKCKVNEVFSSYSDITRGIIQGSGVGPTFYVIMKRDLHTLSAKNVMSKYADDINLIVPEHSDVDLPTEFEHVKNWASDNKMIINLAKTKEIVFRRPSPKQDYLPPSFDCINCVDFVKSLGVFFHYGLNFELHVSHLLRQCSQRIYLLRMLRSQGLSSYHLNIVFQAIVISRILYALPAWGVHLSATQIGRINAFLKRAHKCGFSTELLTVDKLLYSSAATLFKKMKHESHCLNPLLPPTKETDYNLRNSDNTYVLPQCKYNLYKQSFVNWCLFDARL